MLIDGFTVIAQGINFLILVALLRWLLYKPVLRVMRRRQEAIAAEWSAASLQQQAARDSEQRFRQQEQDLEQIRSELVAAMHAEVSEEKRQLLMSARAELASQRDSWQEQLSQDIATSEGFLAQAVSQQVTLATRQVLKALASVELEAQILSLCAAQLRQLSSLEGARWQGDASADVSVEVRTSFELSATQRHELQTQIQTLLGRTVAMSTAIAPELLCGIEIRLPGHTIAWNLAQELQGLQERLASALAAPQTGILSSTNRHDQPDLSATGCF